MLSVKMRDADVCPISLEILIVFVMSNVATTKNVLLISSVKEMSVLIPVKVCAVRTLNAMYTIIDQYVTVTVVTAVILTRFVFEVIVSPFLKQSLLLQLTLTKLSQNYLFSEIYSIYEF